MDGTRIEAESADAPFTDVRFAVLIAREAGDLLVGVRAGYAGGEEADLRALGDRQSQGLLAARLATGFPDDAVLSEEAPDDSQRLESRRVWIIDPLDGTREFAEGRHDWAVHVALWEEGDLVLGAVALPGLGVVLASNPRSEVPLRDERAPLRMAVSRTRPPGFATGLASALGAELVPMGSAGYKIASVIRGEADLYVHAGGQFEWDSAAPVAVARAAGLFTSRVDGSPLIYNNIDPKLPDLLVCRPELAELVLSRINELA
jgi:3'(2'), 5'-bisphosphate nucleotidase